MTADIAIITAVYDSYDELKPVLPQAGPDVEWVLVTDEIPDAEQAAGWTVITKRQDAKYPKFLPWEYTNAPASVWVDASLRVRSAKFAVEALAYAEPLAQFPHPWRDCLYAEATESARLSKYAGEEFGPQTDTYRTFNHPDHWGLWATTVVARQHTPEVRRMGRMWLSQVHQFTFQDQVSQPYVLRTLGLRPNGLPGDQLTNPWTVYEGSARHL